jgi:hypothetical protein
MTTNNYSEIAKSHLKSNLLQTKNKLKIPRGMQPIQKVISDEIDPEHIIFNASSKLEKSELALFMPKHNRNKSNNVINNISNNNMTKSYIKIYTSSTVDNDSPKKTILQQPQISPIRNQDKYQGKHIFLKPNKSSNNLLMSIRIDNSPLQSIKGYDFINTSKQTNRKDKEGFVLNILKDSLNTSKGMFSNQSKLSSPIKPSNTIMLNKSTSFSKLPKKVISSKKNNICEQVPQNEDSKKNFRPFEEMKILTCSAKKGLLDKYKVNVEELSLKRSCSNPYKTPYKEFSKQIKSLNTMEIFQIQTSNQESLFKNKPAHIKESRRMLLEMVK